MRSGNRRYGMKYIESGLDVPFDRASIAEFEAAAASDEWFDEYLALRITRPSA